MKCEKCGSKIKVWYTLPLGKDGEKNIDYPTRILRQRVCPKCKEKTITSEVIKEEPIPNISA